jgi:hypothetical protein
MIAQTGGTCVCGNKDDPVCANDAAYSSCQLGMHPIADRTFQCNNIGQVSNAILSRRASSQILASTCLVSNCGTAATIAGIGSIMFGLLTNLPVALA